MALRFTKYSDRIRIVRERRKERGRKRGRRGYPAKLLHQDISPHNIIITEANKDDDPRGVLIDLDLSVEAGPRKKGEIIRSKPFMAIGVLQRKLHIYRHDLESFLYIILWLAVSDSERSPPATSKLQEWLQRSFSELAKTKIRHMEKEQFGEITAEFAPRFQDPGGLTEELRQILFQVATGALYTGTDVSPEETEKLYNSVIGAFNKAIKRIQSLVPKI